MRGVHRLDKVGGLGHAVEDGVGILEQVVWRVELLNEALVQHQDPENNTSIVMLVSFEIPNLRNVL